MSEKIKIKKSSLSPKVQSIVEIWKGNKNRSSDVLGWYTGTPTLTDDLKPEQDADDL
ncbi:MAG: hypothetical protein IJ262_00135 [Clostridia bacterium]|nr:hypothetical protein [Clostridia bacterium]